MTDQLAQPKQSIVIPLVDIKREIQDESFVNLKESKGKLMFPLQQSRPRLPDKQPSQTMQAPNLNQDQQLPSFATFNQESHQLSQTTRCKQSQGQPDQPLTQSLTSTQPQENNMMQPIEHYRPSEDKDGNSSEKQIIPRRKSRKTMCMDSNSKKTVSVSYLKIDSIGFKNKKANANVISLLLSLVYNVNNE